MDTTWGANMHLKLCKRMFEHDTQSRTSGKLNDDVVHYQLADDTKVHNLKVRTKDNFTFSYVYEED